LAAPESFIVETDSGESFANLQWFELFEDEQLNNLIRIALEENKDLLTAVARVEEARAALGFVRADQFPQVGVNAGAQRGNLLGGAVPGFGINDQFLLAGGVSWEVDLWGKLRRSTESARAQLLANVEAKNVVITTLVSDVATTYLLLLDLDDRVEISKETLRTRKDSTGIIQARYDRGTVPLLDLNQAQIEEADAAAQLVALERERVAAENVLSVLLGRNPASYKRNRSLESLEIPPKIPAGLPSELLERRPDIRQAERELAAQTAQIGVAQALRFPSLSLTGVLGLASTDLDDFLGSDNKAWNIGAALTGPIFDAGKRRSQVEVERARTEQAMYQYEQTVLNAFAEVETTLYSIDALGRELEVREQQVEAARSATKLSRARYDGGVTSYLEVLESERSKFRAELSESIIRRERLSSVVFLYKALGGGWIPEESPEDSE